MKTIRIAALAVLVGWSAVAYSQDVTRENRRHQHYNNGEQFGNTLNAGVGLVYFGYVGQTVPALHLNYEFDVARGFTLAPFLTYFAYRDDRYVVGPNDLLYRNYYRHSVMPLGVKGTYYFDRLLNLNPNWDIYAGASLGAAIQKRVWVEGYYGDRVVERATTGLYLDGHLGTEYHISNNIGLTLDLSTGISTIGIAAHL